MVNENLYKDSPYIPSRDPREINAVERLKQLQAPKEYKVINDDEVQYAEMEKELEVRLDGLEEVGAPGGLVPLDAQGLIDPKYLPEYVPSETAVVTARTVDEFPAVGDTNVLYIAANENDNKGYIYRWCPALGCYEKPYDNLDNVSLVNGGCASDW